jgi:hypothetical protein
MPETVRCAGERGLDLTSRLLSEASADDELFASARPRQSVRMPSALGSALGVSTTCALAISPFISSGCRDSADRRSGRIGSAGDTWPLRKGNRCRVPLAPVVQLDTERRLERAAVSTSARSRRPFACRRFGSDQQADDSVGRPGRGGSSERETATLAVQPAPDARAEPPQTFPFPDPSLQARKQHAQRYTPAVTRPRRFALASAWSKAVASANEPDRSYLRRDFDLERRDRQRRRNLHIEEGQTMPGVPRMPTRTAVRWDACERPGSVRHAPVRRGAPAAHVSSRAHVAGRDSVRLNRLPARVAGPSEVAADRGFRGATATSSAGIGPCAKVGPGGRAADARGRCRLSTRADVRPSGYVSPRAVTGWGEIRPDEWMV